MRMSGIKKFIKFYLSDHAFLLLFVKFLSQLFDLWKMNDTSSISINTFHSLLIFISPKESGPWSFRSQKTNIPKS